MVASAMKPEFDVEKELDAVVGRYDERPRERWLRRYGRWIGRFIAFAALAVAAVAMILVMFDERLTATRGAPAPQKPVPVRIVPPG
jgi:hypothetical protein